MQVYLQVPVHAMHAAWDKVVQPNVVMVGVSLIAGMQGRVVPTDTSPGLLAQSDKQSSSRHAQVEQATWQAIPGQTKFQ